MAHLRIRHWHNDYTAPGSHPAPAALGHQLDALAPQLAQALADQLDALGLDDDAVVLLPRLEIECEIDTACPGEQVVRHWSRQLALAFAHALADPAGDAVRMPSRAAYHARFIERLLRGDGWDSWLFHRFAGLRMLPAGAAIRTLLTEDAATGRATLALLDEASWPMLLAALGEREAVRILYRWHEQEREATEAGALGPAASAWRQAPPGRVAPPLLALWLLAHGGAAQSAGIGALCWLAALLSMPDDMATGELARMATHGVIDKMPALATDPDWLLRLATTPQPVRAAMASLAAQARQMPQDRAQPATGAAQESLDAPFGGLAWLLPALHDLCDLCDSGWASALPAPPAGAGSARDLAVLLALAIAAGHRGERVWRDPFWRTFLQVAPGFALPALHDWLADADACAPARALAATLRRCAFTGAARLRVPAGATRTEVWIEPGSACRLHAMAPPADLAESAPLTFAMRLRLTRLLRQDLALLRASPVLAALPPGWQDLFATLAQAALRRTAFRIPGAACCTLPYLFANVLDTRGEARRDGAAAAAWTLSLRRPPLHVLLSLNGMARLRLTWPGQRQLALHCTE
ncbi:hypothetical protein [Cupriavidus oxalaticus]|uniref:Uncharacterized protein n=1 Tax=Cupriavidus oxalaticus TaxID=96344 RepID=A0A375GJT2_9BURK|nr:hypothetical protein [Cupriavidus oxalaticus]QRQ85038.1 hypothetical protein JTE91_02850 [Cupriavidus oxalaticus]QRQ90874.1 hypothetical protein JTE92_09495 [Cupriavidus oxalaticus]WQD85403.1 hypothetical protein U0036_27620 [Cupriavidus oxalaticus]SPC07459.1 hypothetical protein CO2235_U690002 [Cupriavidus oxalaticus]SPC22033.1 hypothetical protein CO2235_MP60233 [Cupriavidus oxalaticus]